MSGDFADRYTKANLAADAAGFEPDRFRAIINRLEALKPSEKPGYATGLVSAILCAMRRGDIVAELVRNATGNETPGKFEEILTVIRECLTLVVPFAGLPNCMPAVFGLVAEIRARGVDVEEGPQRPGFSERAYHPIGLDTSKAIYRGVGNSDVAAMVGQYFPEISELVVASAIIALGAVRQAQSHCKGAMQLGNSVEVVELVVQVTEELAGWNGDSVPQRLDVPALAQELEKTLAQ
ncbi:hypothetical protein BJY04DRAFT_214834 [Aspergillus karnatakaensis]|uniref:uncharacterized protein n=1 Tax=Aspergillus karnatakaensis TaxID=1810916 RepID=UPI003CCDBBCE